MLAQDHRIMMNYYEHMIFTLYKKTLNIRSMTSFKEKLFSEISKLDIIFWSSFSTQWPQKRSILQNYSSTLIIINFKLRERKEEKSSYHEFQSLPHGMFATWFTQILFQVTGRISEKNEINKEFLKQII